MILDYLITDSLTEIISRLAGGLAAPLLKASRFEIERRIRGRLLKYRFVGRGLKLDRHVQIEGYRSMQCGDDVTLYASSRFVGRYDCKIQIGDRTHIGSHSLVSGLGQVTIGSDCAISSGVRIYSISQDLSINPEDKVLDHVVKKPVNIGDDVWIGANAVILPGVTVGDHAVIGAGAVVTKDVEPWMIVAGVPARPIRDRRSSSS